MLLDNGFFDHVHSNRDNHHFGTSEWAFVGWEEFHLPTVYLTQLCQIVFGFTI